ncbi:MAG: dihydroxyacetone kinase family protein [Acidimicrobiales bacterium]
MHVSSDDDADFADEAIAGFVAANDDRVMRVEGGVVRAEESAPGEVAVVIGGGSGHYPAFAGLVGSGLATAAACGNVFASPSASQVYNVAKAADNGGGVLLSFGNYAGDVLNFAQAAQRLRSEGTDARTVLVTDDIASAPAHKLDQRRGIAGGLAVFKVAGAAAYAGMPLSEVERVATKANMCTRTLGVAFRGCTLPGATAPLFTVPAGQMSVGLGIHGEPGIREVPAPPVGELAELLVGALLAEKPPRPAGRAVVLLNGLGSVKYEELFLLYGKISPLLVRAGVEVVSTECGELVTSLDMAGLSLTLFWVDHELEAFWSAPADAPAYRRGAVQRRGRRATVELQGCTEAKQEHPTEASRRLALSTVSVIEAVARALHEMEQELGALDAVAGDGDHGAGMCRGVDAALGAARRASEQGVGVAGVVRQAGEKWSDRAGGTSGALWGAGICAVASSLGNREVYTTDDLVAAVAAARDAVVTLGKANLGEKTMLDALVPLVEALTEAVARGETTAGALHAGADAATRAARATAPLRPRRGRARPLADKSVGTPDAGAVSLALVVTAAAGYLGPASASGPKGALGGR